MNSVIIQEVVDNTFSGSEVLVWIFDNWFNKEGVKNELLYKV